MEASKSTMCDVCKSKPAVGDCPKCQERNYCSHVCAAVDVNELNHTAFCQIKTDIVRVMPKGKYSRTDHNGRHVMYMHNGKKSKVKKSKMINADMHRTMPNKMAQSDKKGRHVVYMHKGKTRKTKSKKVKSRVEQRMPQLLELIEL